jgi:hypothetical protein
VASRAAVPKKRLGGPTLPGVPFSASLPLCVLCVKGSAVTALTVCPDSQSGLAVPILWHSFVLRLGQTGDHPKRQRSV